MRIGSYPAGPAIYRWLILAFLCVFASPLAAARDAARYEQPGPHGVEVLREALCCDSKGKAIDLYVPDANKPVPVVLWGNGSWASPEKYEFLLRHLASWGMAVAATRDDAMAQGETMLDALALLAQGEPPVAFDPSRVAAVGHSQGAGGSVNAAIRSREVDTVIAVDLPARKRCQPGDCEDIPTGLPGDISILFLSGARDPLSPVEAAGSYYDAVPDGIARAMAMVVDADHNDIQGQPKCGFLAIGCRNGVEGYLPYVTAWLAWQLDIEAGARDVFVGPAADFTEDPRLANAAIWAR